MRFRSSFTKTVVWLRKSLQIFVPATSAAEGIAKVRYVLNAASLAPADAHHRDLVVAVLADPRRRELMQDNPQGE
jgi:hypothetical protein